jgi:hypothetical protein
MKASAKLFGWAITISFVGTLPLGTLNLSVANYAFRHAVSGAIGFSAAAIAVEVILVRVALVAIRRLERLTHFYKVFNILTTGVLLFLAFNSLLAAWQMQAFRAGLPVSFLHPVLAGLILSLTNPLHLPFWLGWTTALRNRKVLDDRRKSYNVFIVAIGLGTAAAFCLYGFAGGYFIGLLGRQQVLLNWVIGIALLVTALAQLHKAFLKNWTRALLLAGIFQVTMGIRVQAQCEQALRHRIEWSTVDSARLEKEYGARKRCSPATRTRSPS